jgi:hypothetical protein
MVMSGVTMGADYAIITPPRNLIVHGGGFFMKNQWFARRGGIGMVEKSFDLAGDLGQWSAPSTPNQA